MRDEAYWQTERDFGGMLPMSLNQMRERAGRAIATRAYSSESEMTMARIIAFLIDELERQRSESVEPPR